MLPPDCNAVVHCAAAKSAESIITGALSGWVYRPGLQAGSADWVCGLGLGTGSAGWVCGLGMPAGSGDWVCRWDLPVGLGARNCLVGWEPPSFSLDRPHAGRRRLQASVILVIIEIPELIA